MQRLIDGVVQFRHDDFESHKELFRNLGSNQEPHTLFIGCSDSRVVPNMITSTLPGELFVIRNVANIVPLYRATEEYVATTSAIEYAMVQLPIENIVVCGHSNCGGCQALYFPEERLAAMPLTRKWLEQAHGVRDRVLAEVGDDNPGKREWLTEQSNIVEQMKHLLSYPAIADRYMEGKVLIHGWHYIIETGEIFAWQRSKGYFELIN
jgi:carbonic anhydrase